MLALEQLGQVEIELALHEAGQRADLRGGEPEPRTQQELDRKLAVKVLRAELGEDALRPRLLREAQAMARVRHPNVVMVYDVGVLDDQVYLVMELVEGPTLTEWLREPRSWREILAVFVEAGRGLAAAHEAELVHRDFKPDNVIIEASGRDHLRIASSDGVVRAVRGAEVLGPRLRFVRLSRDGGTLAVIDGESTITELELETGHSQVRWRPGTSAFSFSGTLDYDVNGGFVAALQMLDGDLWIAEGRF